jgi:glycolate oxidase FAD binding subunit
VATAAEAARAEFAGIVGETQLTQEPSACVQFAVDGKVPDCVVFPNTPEQTAQVLKCAADRDLAVIVAGGTTRLGLGNPPRRYDVALCTRKLTKISYYEPADLTAGVGAGTPLEDLQNLLRRDRLWLPLDPPGSGRTTLGGVVATNAAGPLRHSYGTPRDMVVGMQIATTSGKLIRTGGRVVKNVAGYDLGKLLIGSYGTLGVITEVNLKLYPLPVERETSVFSIGTLSIARDLRLRILNSPVSLLRMALMDAETAEVFSFGGQSGRGGPQLELWVEAGGSKSVISRTWRDLNELGRAVSAGFRVQEGESAQEAWQAISDFDNRLRSTYPEAVVLKCILPIAEAEEFLGLVQQEAQNERVRTPFVVYPGVGIIHIGLLDLQNAVRAAGLIHRIRAAAEKAGGAVVVVYATPEIKAQVDVWGTPPSGFDLMRRMKATWDPKGTLAPGRFAGSI